MIELTPHAEGTILPVHAQPGARRNAILGERAGALRVAVTAAPEKGKANAAIAGAAGREPGLPAVAGRRCSPARPRGRNGSWSRGLTPDELRPRIAALLPDPGPTLAPGADRTVAMTTDAHARLSRRDHDRPLDRPAAPRPSSAFPAPRA